MEEVVLIDAELPPDVVFARIPAEATPVTLGRPLAGYRVIRDHFDRLHRVIVDARREGVARLRLSGLDPHDADLAAILEVGFAVELHVFLAVVFADLRPAQVRVLARRPVFADVAETFFARRGVPTTRSMSLNANTSSDRRRYLGYLEQLGAARQRAQQWFQSERRVYAAAHRQTTPVASELIRRGVAVATPRLNSLLGLGMRPLAAPDLQQAELVTRRLREYGAARLTGPMQEAWHSLLDHFERELPRTLTQLETTLAGLDILQPDFLLAPAWGGVDAHAFRAWSRSSNVPFGVVQHGFNIGSYPCTRTRAVDADVFYAWSKSFAREWIEPTWNERVDIVTHGNPAYDRVTHRAPRTPQTVMLAPAGVLEFGRHALLEFWGTSFALVEGRRDVKWKLRPHGHGKNNDWIRARADELGALWSRDIEPDLNDALADVDILVTMVSSIAVDAMVRGILVVVINHLGETPLFLPEVCAGYVTDRSAAAAVVNELLDSPAARAAAYERQQTVVKQFETSGVVASIAADISGRIAPR